MCRLHLCPIVRKSLVLAIRALWLRLCQTNGRKAFGTPCSSMFHQYRHRNSIESPPEMSKYLSSSEPCLSRCFACHLCSSFIYVATSMPLRPLGTDCRFFRSWPGGQVNTPIDTATTSPTNDVYKFVREGGRSFFSLQHKESLYPHSFAAEGNIPACFSKKVLFVFKISIF